VKDRIYLVVAGVIVLMIVADVFANNSQASLYLIEKLFHLVDFVEFWR
jgi:hypothetical protein